MSKNKGGPAFPQHPQAWEIGVDNSGLSIRDYFAGQALSGLVGMHDQYIHNDYLAENVYSIADAMCRTREKTRDE